MASTPLTEILRAVAGPGLAPPSDDERIEATLARVVRDAAAANPGVTLPLDAFVRHLARHVPRDGAWIRALEGLDAAALFLCCACARGDAAALAAIERLHFDKARAALRRIRGSETLEDDVTQRLREILFLPSKEGKEPKIAKYGGRGDLGGWLRTVAMREAFEQVQPTREIPSSDASLAGAAAPSASPEDRMIKAEYGGRFNRAVDEAMRALPKESRRDLRRYYFEGQGVEAIGARDGVAVSTVSRRLAKARMLLLEKVREILARDFAIAPDELDSMIRVVQTQLDITRGALAADREAGETVTRAAPAKTPKKRKP